jgi:HSP20 family molecular chaperone IbpA
MFEDWTLLIAFREKIPLNYTYMNQPHKSGTQHVRTAAFCENGVYTLLVLDDIFPPFFWGSCRLKMICMMKTLLKNLVSHKKWKEKRDMISGTSKNITSLTVEPSTKLLDDGKFLHILTELPGVAEEKIKIDVENHSTSVTIVATDNMKHYKKVIIIPCEVIFSKKRFSEGVLELTLEKVNSDTPW